jgi:tetratricopeptide (TPR) repeat protein
MGEDQPHTYLGMQRLARVYTLQGRYNEAKAMYKKVWEGQKDKLGYNHEFTIKSMTNLAAISRIQGRYKECKRLCKEAVSRFQEVVGETSVAIISAKQQLASILCALGRYEEAESAQRSACDADGQEGRTVRTLCKQKKLLSFTSKRPS